MKLTSLLVFLAVLGNATAHTVYQVQPSTKGNRIDLTIANQSGIAPVEVLEARALDYPSKITFKSTVETVGSIPPHGEKTVSFTFDVARPTKPGDDSQDTLKFVIADKSGSMWERSIILAYTLPVTFVLEQNFPNPFNPSTTIYYELPAESKVNLQVFNVLGQLVATLVDENKPAGYHEVRFDATAFPSGVYFYRMQGTPIADSPSSFTTVKKMMTVK